MRTVAFIAALVGSTFAVPQAVTSAVAPDESTPAGCQTSYNGKFQVVVQTLKKRSLEARDSSPLELTLTDGVLKDSQGRTGYIASNQQFQFDGPVQAGALYTAGWSVCANGSIALGDSAVFYQCLSGTFYNLYDENTAAQCSPVFLNALGSATTTSANAPANNVASAGAHTVVCQIGDGQIQQDTCITTATAPPTTSSKPTGVTVTQISDGQIQAPGATATQISDGQVQAPVTTSAAVLVGTGVPVSQATDGQVQAGNSTLPVTTRVPTTTAAAVTTAPVAKSANGASSVFGPPAVGSELMGLVAAIAAVAFLL